MKHLQVPILLLLCCATVLFSQTTWTSKTLGDTLTFSAIAYGNNRYVTTGVNGIVYTSPDGIIWTKGTLGTTYNQYDITYINNKFVSVGVAQIIPTSPDGITWTPVTTYGGTLQSVAYGFNRYVAVGYSAYVSSPMHPSSIVIEDLQITWSDGEKYVSKISESANGAYLLGITFGNNMFVGVGYDQRLWTASDSTISWVPRYSDHMDLVSTLVSVTYGNNLFVAVGGGGIIVTSPDGITWTNRTSGTTNTLTDVAYGNNQFVAVGLGGTIISSPDGITWTSNTSGVTTELLGVTYGKNRFVAVGANETILTSSPANNAVTYTVPKQNHSVGGKTMQIYTLQGKLVSNQLVNNENYMDGKNSLYKNLSKGMYIVRIPTDNMVVSRRVLVE